MGSNGADEDLGRGQRQEPRTTKWKGYGYLYAS